MYFWSGQEVKKKKKVKQTESEGQRAQLYFLFTQSLFETVGRNRGCIHLFFSTSVDPLPPPSFSSESILLQFLIFSLSLQLSLFLPPSSLADKLYRTSEDVSDQAACRCVW